jgi:hypothetical protein
MPPLTAPALAARVDEPTIPLAYGMSSRVYALLPRATVGHRSYAAAVRHRVAVIGGRWDVFEDATHDQHTISPYALSVIFNDLDSQPR